MKVKSFISHQNRSHIFLAQIYDVLRFRANDAAAFQGQKNFSIFRICPSGTLMLLHPGRQIVCDFSFAPMHMESSIIYLNCFCGKFAAAPVAVGGRLPVAICSFSEAPFDFSLLGLIRLCHRLCRIGWGYYGQWLMAKLQQQLPIADCRLLLQLPLQLLLVLP